MTDTTITQINITHLHESPFNPRRTFGEAGLQELAADIKAQGILSPLLVRPRTVPLFADDPNGSCGFELVFGHRRLRAATLAGLATVPCMVRALTDEEAKRAQISENLAREDVHPIEEAEGFDALMRDHAITADQLVEQTGKSRSYIYGRLKLLQACPEVRTACLEGRIGSEVALLLARLRTAKLQGQALGYIKGRNINVEDGGQRSFRDIRDLLRERFTLDLSKKACLFDTTDPALLPNAGACTECPKRLGNASEYADLLADGGAVGRYGRAVILSPETCTDPDCFDAKKQAHLVAAAAQTRALGKEVVAGNKARAAVDAQGNVKGAYVALQDAKAALKAAGQKGAITAVVIQDPRTGKLFNAVAVESLKAAGIKVKEPISRAQDTHREKQRKEDEARTAKVEVARQESAYRLQLLKVVRARMDAQPRSAFDLHLVARVALAGVDYHARGTLATLWECADFNALEERLGQFSVPHLTRLMMDCALVGDIPASPYHTRAPETLMAAAKCYGVDTATVKAAFIQASAQPEPTPSTAARAGKVASGKAAGGAKSAKYRCAATGMTWSGRGMQPAWLRAALEQGRTLAEFDTTHRCAGGQRDDADLFEEESA